MDPKLKAFSLTFVQYEQGDPVGLLLAVASLIPIFLLVSFATLAVTNRNCRVVFFAIGIVVNESINFVLKRLLNHERPNGSDRVDPGMPSSHAQYMGFFATYLTYVLIYRIRWRMPALNHAGVLAAWSAAVLVCISRVYLEYHFVSQVVVGILVGACTGSAWSKLDMLYTDQLFQYLTTSWIGKLFLLTDGTKIDNLLLVNHELSVKSKTS